MTQITRNTKEYEEQILSFMTNNNGYDVDVILKDQRLSLHSIVLAGNSDYFKVNLFSTPLVPKEFKLDGVNTQRTKQILDYCYTGHMELEPKDALDILEIAKHLMMKNLIQGSSGHLDLTPTIENWFEVWNLARRYELKDPERSCLKFIDENFKKISMSDSFLELDATELVDILKFDVKNRSEEDVINSIERWLKKNYETRSKYITTLLKHMNLSLLSDEILEPKYEYLCNTDENCFKLITKTLIEKNKSKLDTTESNSTVSVMKPVITAPESVITEPKPVITAQNASITLSKKYSSKLKIKV